MLQGDYLGMRLTVEDVDKENAAFFGYCANGEFRLQRGKTSGLLRYPPTTACPWSGERDYDWVVVEGKGAVHSYGEVHHGIQPAFKERVPYLILLVDLDGEVQGFTTLAFNPRNFHHPAGEEFEIRFNLCVMNSEAVDGQWSVMRMRTYKDDAIGVVRTS